MLTFPFNNDVKFTVLPKHKGVKIPQPDMVGLKVKIENLNQKISFEPEWKWNDVGIEIEIQREKIPLATTYHVTLDWRKPDGSFSDKYQDLFGKETIQYTSDACHNDCGFVAMEMYPDFKGDSAYEIAVKHGFEGTEEEWLESIGGDGTGTGPKGDSAYQVAVKNGFVGTVDEWLESLKGKEGNPGVGVPAGGAPGQALVKKTSDDYDTEWKTLSSGGGAGDGNDGKTPVIGSITAESIPSTEQPSFSLTHTSSDGDGNPVYTGTIKIPKGKDGKDGNDGDDGIDGKTPVFEIGTVETLAAGSQATASIVSDGETTEGNPKYKVNFGIPKGASGTGDGGGTVSLAWEDIEGKPSWIGATKPTYTTLEIGALPTAHNSDTEAHGGIAAKVSTLETKVQTLENTETVNLEIKKIYSSIAVMESDFSTTDVAFGEFVAIESNDEDNGSLFIKNTSNWGYMGKVGQSAGDSYIPNNLIDFDKIVIGKKVTGAVVNNINKTWELTIEDNPNFAYVELDVEAFAERCTLQGMRNDNSGNNYSIYGVRLSSNNLYVSAPIEYSDAYANDLYTTARLVSDSNVYKVRVLNIPIDTPEKLANIYPETSELTLYKGWAHKEFDAKGIKPPVFIERTRNLSDKRYLRREGAGNFQLGYIPIEQEVDYLICGLINNSNQGALTFHDENYTNVGSVTSYNLQNSDEVLRITGRYGGYFNADSFPTAKYVSIRMTSYGIPETFDYVRKNDFVVQERKYGFEFASLFQPVGGVGRYEFEDHKKFLPANKRLGKLLNLAFLGDSQTHANWYMFIKNHVQINSIYSKGVSGLAWMGSGTVPIFTGLVSAYQNGEVKGCDGEVVPHPDYIFMLISNGSATAGDPATVMGKSISELNPTASQAEAIRYNINVLRNAFPDTTLIMFTAFQIFDGGDTRRERGLQIQDMAERMSVRSYNLWNTLGIDPVYEVSGGNGRYLVDGTHLNENGKALLSKYAAQIIKSLEI